jgi:hypothetical protein
MSDKLDGGDAAQYAAHRMARLRPECQSVWAMIA